MKNTLTTGMCVDGDEDEINQINAQSNGAVSGMGNQ